jgi:hypothetical protein
MTKNVTSSARRDLRRRRLTLASGYSLTSCFVAPILQAAHRNAAAKDGRKAGLYPVKSRFPLLGERLVPVKMTTTAPVKTAPEVDSSQRATALSGDRR